MTTTEPIDEQQLTWRLSDAGMDLLERAGLAALYMALQAARDRAVDLAPLTWRDDDLTADSVTVRWAGSAKPAFQKLMEWAWQVKDGVLYLPAVHNEGDAIKLHNRVAMHNGIMRTFLQHTNVQPKGEPVTRILTLGENPEVSVSFQPPIIRPPKGANGGNARDKSPKKLLKPWKDVEQLFDRKGQLVTKDVELSNWVYPGIAGRYAGEKAWVGPADRAVLLMLAPTVCLFMRLQGEGGNWVLVAPDVHDLEEMACERPRMALNPDYSDVASLGDAAMKFLARYATNQPRRAMRAGCRVMAMGKVRYYASQSIRKAVLDVAAKERSLRQYRILHREMQNNYIEIKVEQREPTKDVKPMRRGKKVAATTTSQAEAPKAAGFIKIPAARGRIADNLVTDRPWYTDLAVPQIWDLDEMERRRKRQPGISIERLWFQAICYQRSKLMRLIAEDDMWNTEAEKVFVHAFWETLDSLYAQEAAANERGGSRTAAERFEDLNDDLRRRILQAKTRTLLRAALSGILAKAGRQRTIRSHPAVIWRLIDHPDDWRKGRDLALLALASHRKKEDRESCPGSA